MIRIKKRLAPSGSNMTEIFSDEDTAKLFQLVHMFQRSALLHMGYIPDQNGNRYFDTVSYTHLTLPTNREV